MTEIKIGQRWKYTQPSNQEWNIGNIISLLRYGGNYSVLIKSSRCDWAKIGSKYWVPSNSAHINYSLLPNQDAPDEIK